MHLAQWSLPFLCVSALVAQHDYTPADVEEGARLYRSACASCHGAEGNTIENADLRRGQFRRATSDEDLQRIITNGIPGTPMPPSTFSGRQARAVVAFLRSMRDAPVRKAAAGDPRRGQSLFEGKGACLTCHRVHGEGSRTGPDLSDVGAIRRAEELEHSVIDPNANVKPYHRFIEAVTREGVTITGRRLNEDTHTVQLIDSSERLVSLSKDKLRSFSARAASPMPSYRGKLASQELADLVSYLSSLKGSPPK
ncbi:MAG: c-type cytochrome [Bryobacteraceae bacterium]